MAKEGKDMPEAIEFIQQLWSFHSYDIPPIQEGQQSISKGQFCSLKHAVCSRDPY